MPSKDKRKLAAIMFADVVGYSRMMASNEERTLELLKDFENICSSIISKHDGEIIKKAKHPFSVVPPFNNKEMLISVTNQLR